MTCSNDSIGSLLCVEYAYESGLVVSIGSRLCVEYESGLTGSSGSCLRVDGDSGLEGTSVDRRVGGCRGIFEKVDESDIGNTGAISGWVSCSGCNCGSVGFGGPCSNSRCCSSFGGSNWVLNGPLLMSGSNVSSLLTPPSTSGCSTGSISVSWSSLDP